MVKVVILAGGEGTRLRPLTLTRPKPMLPLGSRTVIDHLLSHLMKQGFREFIITLSYLKEVVTHHLGDGTPFGAKIDYSVEPERIFLGTAGSVKLASHLLREAFAVVQGDAFTEIDLMKVVMFHREAGADATIVTKEIATPWLYGVVVSDAARRISAFQEKPPKEECLSNQISTGIYVLEPEVLDFITPGPCDFARDVFPRLLRAGKRMFSYAAPEYWIDIGSLDGYLQGMRRVLDEVSSELRAKVDAQIEGRVAIGHDVTVHPGAKIQGPVLIEDGVSIAEDAQIGPYVVLKEDVTVRTHSVLAHAALFEGVTIGAVGRVQESVIGEMASLGNDVTVQKSVIGQGSELGEFVRVLPGSRIWPSVYVAPHRVVDGVLVLPADRPFYFHADIGRYTGVAATSLADFIPAVERVEPTSLEFHLYRRDFERWIRDVFQAHGLAEAIGELRKAGVKGDALRARLIATVAQWQAVEQQ